MKKSTSNINELVESAKPFANPEELFPKNTSMRFLKKMLLRSLRVYTSLQILFNTKVHEILQAISRQLSAHSSQLQKVSTDLELLRGEWDKEQTKIVKQHVEKVDAILQDKFTALRASLKAPSQKDYKSLYFPQFEDDFYLFQQDKFRGSYKMIFERQQKYNSYIQKVQKLSEQSPFVDIGFGRGEFLEVLEKQKIKKIIGVDTNKKYCEQGKAHGYETIHADGVSFMQNYKGKLSGVSAFHVIEHLTFEQLFDMMYLAHMKLEPGGLLLFETPNPENVLVSSTTFYIDHTHISKLPPDFMRSMFEFFGFRDIEVLYNIFVKEKPDNDYDKYLFGAMDYAILAYK